VARAGRGALARAAAAEQRAARLAEEAGDLDAQLRAERQEKEVLRSLTLSFTGSGGV